MKPTAFHQPREPKAILRLSLEFVDRDADTVVELIRSTIFRKRGPVRLFVSMDGCVYILPLTDPAADRWPTQQFAWFVGTYGYVHRDNEPMLRPDLDGIREDLREHAENLGFRLKRSEVRAG